MDPYDVLQLPRNFTLEQLRANYKRLALQLHPDKLGARVAPDAAHEVFHVLTGAYRALSREYRARASDRPFDALRADARPPAAGGGGGGRAGGPPPSADGTDFDPDRFNRVFEETRGEPGRADRGYEAWMRRHDPDAGPPPEPARQVVRYREPVAAAEMLSARRGGGGGMTYSELGVDRVSDFSKPAGAAGGVAGGAVAYTDYRLAHTRTRLMYEDEISAAAARRKDFRSVDDIRAHRAGQSFDMTEEDHRRAAAAQRARAKDEERRARVQGELDRRAEAAYSRSHEQLLGYAPSASITAR